MAEPPAGRPDVGVAVAVDVSQPVEQATKVAAVERPVPHASERAPNDGRLAAHDFPSSAAEPQPLETDREPGQTEASDGLLGAPRMVVVVNEPGVRPEPRASAEVPQEPGSDASLPPAQTGGQPQLARQEPVAREQPVSITMRTQEQPPAVEAEARPAEEPKNEDQPKIAEAQPLAPEGVLLDHAVPEQPVGERIVLVVEEANAHRETQHEELRPATEQPVMIAMRSPEEAGKTEIAVQSVRPPEMFDVRSAVRQATTEMEVEPSHQEAATLLAQTQQPQENAAASMPGQSPRPQEAPAAGTAPKGSEPGPGKKELPAAAPADIDTRPIGELTTDIRCREGDRPGDVAQQKLAGMRTAAYNTLAERDWQTVCCYWEAPSLCHLPLYFEEVNLERYGYRWPCVGPMQPVVSGAHFFANVPILPYKMVAEHCHECVYTLGHYRPGSCNPYQIHYPPASVTAGGIEGGMIVGLLFAIP